MSRTTRLGIALGLNLALVVVQAAFGLVAHSLGLLSDAGHNMTDVAAVLISLIAVRYARRAPTESRSYGYHRGTILAALANAVAILVVTALIVFEAVRRLTHPTEVRGGIVVVVALVAFVINAGSGVVLHERGGHGHGGADLNMRSALLHMAGDAVASIGVAIAGLVILVTGRFDWLDPAVSVGIAVLIALEAVRLVRQAADVLLESTPRDLDVGNLSDAIVDVEGVDEVHDLHVWSLSSDVRALSAHLVLSGHPSLEEAQIVGERVKRRIGPAFAIAHATLELECESCSDGVADPCVMDPAMVVASARRSLHHGGHDHAARGR
ncbi:MAG: cation diffusion facilitator family transporter [Acidimicrobiales bacterium]